jgi:Lsr2
MTADVVGKLRSHYPGHSGEEGATMATKVLTTLQDDIDGSDATQTVRFALDGVEYEIDVSDRNANRLRNSLSEFIAHGRRVGGRRGPKPASSSDVDTKAVRKWAEANGIEINARGRIPTDVVERFKAAGN